MCHRADEDGFNVPSMSLDFDLESEQGDLSPTSRANSLGYGIASLAAEEADDGHGGQGIALVVDAEVTGLSLKMLSIANIPAAAHIGLRVNSPILSFSCVCRIGEVIRHVWLYSCRKRYLDSYLRNTSSAVWLFRHGKSYDCKICD